MSAYLTSNTLRTRRDLAPSALDAARLSVYRLGLHHWMSAEDGLLIVDGRCAGSVEPTLVAKLTGVP